MQSSGPNTAARYSAAATFSSAVIASPDVMHRYPYVLQNGNFQDFANLPLLKCVKVLIFAGAPAAANTTSLSLLSCYDTQSCTLLVSKIKKSYTLCFITIRPSKFTLIQP
jgi:hypothetical protein